MELLLNLLWLALAMPAIWVWRRNPATVGSSPAPGPLRASLLLICVLALLFPVISASDDLHPMRPEMEESNPSRRVAKQAHAASPILGMAPPDGFLVAAKFDLQLGRVHESEAFFEPCLVPEVAPLSPHGSRAPPFFFFS